MTLARVQISARGIDLDRHLVTCQGVPVPLTPTSSSADAFYAGIRFKAWSPWSSLHPSIDVRAPLHVGVVDIASETSIGGATYRVVHPGGRNYDHPPVNANGAEVRRASRFEARGHTTGRLVVAEMRTRAAGATTPDHPHTLDLRRAVR